MKTQTRESVVTSIQRRGMVPFAGSSSSYKGVTRMLEMWVGPDGATTVLVTMQDEGQERLVLFAPVWSNDEELEELDVCLDLVSSGGEP